MKKIALFALMALIGSAANAATVTFTLDLSPAQGAPGTFTLSAKTSAGDNAGLASYSVELSGAILTANHNSLRNTSASNGAGTLEGPVGFTLLRTADVNSAPATGIVQFAGSQDIPGATPFIVYGLGQTPGNLAALDIVTAGIKEGDPWLADMVIAKGTYTYSGNPQQPGIGFLAGSGLTLANTFNASGAPANAAATIQTVVLPIPEPASFALAGLGMLGFAGLRRRFAC